MSHDIYGLCCRYQGKVVKIREHTGRVHVGKITRVTKTHVYIQPAGGGLGGLGYGFYGGWGWRPGVGYGLALGAITGLALAGLFFW